MLAGKLHLGKPCSLKTCSFLILVSWQIFLICPKGPRVALHSTLYISNQCSDGSRPKFLTPFGQIIGPGLVSHHQFFFDFRSKKISLGRVKKYPGQSWMAPFLLQVRSILMPSQCPYLLNP